MLMASAGSTHPLLFANTATLEWDIQVATVGLTPLAPTISHRCRELRRHGRRERVSPADRSLVDLLAPPNDQVGAHWVPQ